MNENRFKEYVAITVLETATVTYRLALYDGAQYSDVHVFVVTVNDA